MRFWVLLLVFWGGASFEAQAQMVRINIEGRTLDDQLSFSGVSEFYILKWRGDISGQLDTGERCSGTTRMNLLLTKGTGELSCGDDLSATFQYSVSSKIPVRGRGTATLNDGRKAELRLWE